MKHITKILLLTLALSLLLCGCAAKEKTFETEGMKIVLTNRFIEQDQEGFTTTYVSSNAVVLALKETFETLEDADLDRDLSLEEYAELVMLSNSLDAKPQTKDGLTYFVYESTVDGVTYSYLAVVYKATDAYWLVQFATQQSDYAAMEETLFTYAKSVSFAQ